MTTLPPKFVLPKIAVRTSAIMLTAMVLSAVLAYLATPRLTEITDAPSLEATVPRQFGDWKELPNPYIQVSLSTGTEPNIDQPYDQSVMRSYVNSMGQQVHLALAWGKRQRQEVKIHRPDLCYVAQGYTIRGLAAEDFRTISAAGKDIRGKNMIAMNNRNGEAVAYWIRIGSLYSESALESRIHIFKEGLANRIPDGILVRASQTISNEAQAAKAFPLLNAFLTEFYASASPELKSMMVR